MSFHLTGPLENPSRTAAGDVCPIDRALGVLGTRSAILLLREASYGTTRFDEFVQRTGLTESVTAGRLRDLVADGLLVRSAYQEPGKRRRSEYLLTDAGRDVAPLLVALADWGRVHADRQRSVGLVHHDCGQPVIATLACLSGHQVTPESVDVGI